LPELVADLDLEHLLKVSKTRCWLMDGKTCVKPGKEFILPFVEWLAWGVVAQVVEPANPDARTLAALTEKCLPQQREEIIALAQQVGMDAADLKKAVVKRGVQKVADLTIDQADEMTFNLKVLRDKKGKDVPF
jgi:hypothetical protein